MRVYVFILYVLLLHWYEGPLAPEQWTPWDIAGVVCVILYLAVLVEHQLVTNRQRP